MFCVGTVYIGLLETVTSVVAKFIPSFDSSDHTYQAGYLKTKTN
jgi:hypothetical protein